jgi:hypothetical protein
MRREQDANREARLRLGVGVGDGVATGLEATEARGASIPAHPVLSVRSGLAINRLGEAIELAVDCEVSLVRVGRRPDQSPGTRGTTGSTPFAACRALVPGAFFTESGVYLLTIAPAPGLMGRAPTSGLGNALAPCNSDFSAEGVKFELLHLNVSDTVLGDLLDDDDRIRNHLAHLMFGTADPRRDSSLPDPFGDDDSRYGFLDDLRPNCLRDEQVPLAVLHWTPGQGIAFLDMWSVRRRPTRLSTGSSWSGLVADRRLSESEAMFQQFQEQLDDLLRKEPGAVLARATERFTFLPPAGLLPLSGSGRRGFDSTRFFEGLTTRSRTPIPFADGARVESLLRSSLAYPPIDLSSNETLWRYVVRQNAQGDGQQYVLFASGYMPYAADAQFDLSRADFANFALRLC